MLDIIQRLSRFRVGQHQLAVGLVDVAASASPRRTGLRPTGTIPDIPAATSMAEEERGVLQQHADVWWPMPGPIAGAAPQ